MFSNTTVSSRSSSSCNSSSIRVPRGGPLAPKTSFNPIFRQTDALTSFDASHFIFHESSKSNNPILKRYHSHDPNSDERAKESDSVTTPESTQSRGSDSLQHEYDARTFLERYSLPRVVRVGGGEPMLLYRCFDSFTKIQARCVCGKKKESHVLQFPEGYTGWFSLTNEKGEKSAVVHTTILQLVREQVCSFISMQPFTAYASQVEASDGKVQYLKTQVRPGQLFQLRAVFQHKEGAGKSSTRSSRISRSARDKDLQNRYAQIVSQTNQEFYVPLTVKGEFYEIHSSMKAKLCFPGMLDKTGPLALDKDCLYKITHLLRRVALPVRVKLIAGPLPQGLPKDFTDIFVLERKFQEPLLVTCTLPPPNQDRIPHEISCINLNSNPKISKCILGFDSENRLFKSQRLQAALAFCHKNVENWYREVKMVGANLNPEPKLCLQCRKSACNCLKDSHEPKQLITKEVIEKFPKPKKWYKKLIGKSDGDDLKDVMDVPENAKSMERYKDMSKLIEEKFGKRNHNPVKKSASFMFATKRMDLEEPDDGKSNAALLKCQSLDTQLYSIEETQGKASMRSYDFQMCILENDTTPIIPKEERVKRKSKPDLIPTLPSPAHSYITEKLCDEFHVKTKVQMGPKPRVTTVKVQVHEVDVPYSHVADEVSSHKSGATCENIYAEICDDAPTSTSCDSKHKHVCDCKNRTSTDYCYVKLGSNGDSVVQSDSDEAIYNTIR